MIKDPTTKEQRQERSRIKDLKFRKEMKELSYKDEGELFLLSVKNSYVERIKKNDCFQVV